LDEYDVVVVGAGILGLSTSYYTKKKCPKIKILVVDKLNSVGQGNTALSASAFRCLFSSRTNLALAGSSINFYKHLQENLGVDLGLRFVGYLWLLSETGYNEAIQILRRISEEGIEYKEYDGKELTQRIGLNTELTGDQEAQLMKLENVPRGVLITKAGIFDADKIVKFYEEQFLKLGGKIKYNVFVKSLITEAREPLGIPGEPYFWQEARIAGVNTSEGVIRAKKTVLATGAWTSQLTDDIGIECFVKPKKRQIFPVECKSSNLRELLHAKGFNKYNCLPFTFLDKPRIYIRPFPESGKFWLGIADEFPRPFRLEDKPLAEKSFYEYGTHPVISKYFPQFKDAHPTSPFAGHYSVCTIDNHPVVFEDKDLIVVCGASGSGIQKADAIGRIAAALYTDEDYAILYGGKRFKVSNLGLQSRKTEPEKLII
jgi:glycine/D-amino acid oxidase-like deaminating enzyme